MFIHVQVSSYCRTLFLTTSFLSKSYWAKIMCVRFLTDQARPESFYSEGEKVWMREVHITCLTGRDSTVWSEHNPGSNHDRLKNLMEAISTHYLCNALIKDFQVGSMFPCSKLPPESSFYLTPRLLKMHLRDWKILHDEEKTRGSIS